MTDIEYRQRRGVFPPAELRVRVAGLLMRLGPRAAAKALGVHREQLISVAAGVPVLAGTIALVEQRLREGGGA
ncbi:MAG: hypothetical protein ABUL60_21130 [Myxococcales bacterium]